MSYPRPSWKKALPDYEGGLKTALALLENKTGFKVSPKTLIPPEMTFRQWCEKLGREGLKVDGHPFTLTNRKALWEIYDQIPTTKEEAFGQTLVLQKGSQMGLTILECIANLYMAIKFAPCKVLMYLPDRSMASYKSAQRFMPLVRSVPSIHKYIAGESGLNEGNTLTRVMSELDSNFVFLWTSGKQGGATESFPGDVLSLDELQGMTLEQIDRVSERLSASSIKFKLFLSTPLWPEMDINAWFLLGTQRKFHTDCGCADGVILTDVFLQAALTNNGKIPITFNGEGRFQGAPEDFVYFCPECGQYIPDPQTGRWIAHNPKASVRSYHMSQILSPTVTARELLQAWGRADNADRKQNFFCRKLGTPYSDVSQVPITMEILRQCVEEGLRQGVQWKKTAKNTVMGVDQMGSFSVVHVAERLVSGKMAIIHIEAIYALDPWARLDELISNYGVQICVAEQLPNIDSARQFAKRHEGKVFLITSYGDLEDLVEWGDVLVTKSERKIGDEYRNRYTVRADQYRCMSWAFARLAEQYIVFPDPQLLLQEVREDGAGRKAPVLQEMFFLHYTKTGLILEEDDEQRKVKRKVIKIGLDPHASFSLMALCIGWFRAHGQTTFILPSAEKEGGKIQQHVQKTMPGLPKQVVEMIQEIPAGEICGRCAAFNQETGQCAERQLIVSARDPGCILFIATGS